MRRLIVNLAVVVGVSAVATLSGCGGGPPEPPPGLDEVELAGWQAYVDLGCGKCHGANREGLRTGPPLEDLDRHWTVDRLVRYLEDPDAVIAGDPQLASRAEPYAIGMPKVSGKSPGYGEKAAEERLRALAAFLLAEPAAGD